MRKIGDPDYVYTPHSEERRKKQREKSLARFAPLGFRYVFGVWVPDRWHAVIRHLAYTYRRMNKGEGESTIEDTEQLVRDLMEFLASVEES